MNKPFCWKNAAHSGNEFLRAWWLAEGPSVSNDIIGCDSQCSLGTRWFLKIGLQHGKNGYLSGWSQLIETRDGATILKYDQINTIVAGVYVIPAAQ